MVVQERGCCCGGSAVGKQLLGTGLQLICCVQLLGASEVWGDMYSMYSVAPFREAMLSGAGHCRANVVIFLQEVCYAQMGCEASCVWRKQEIWYVSGAGQYWVNIVHLRTR